MNYFENPSRQNFLDFIGFDLVDADFDEAIYPVIRGRKGLRVIHRNIEGNDFQIRQAVLPHPGSNSQGAWVEGSRSATVDVARRLGLRSITEGERHHRGARHIHGRSSGRWSTHIFYGRRVPRPDQDFFA